MIGETGRRPLRVRCVVPAMVGVLCLGCSPGNSSSSGTPSPTMTGPQTPSSTATPSASRATPSPAEGRPTTTTGTPEPERSSSPATSTTTGPTSPRPQSPSPSAERLQYSVRVSPDRPAVDQEVRISVTAPDYMNPRVERIEFGDGTHYECTYSPNGHSEDCEGYGEPGTQYCYHVYQRPGRYTVRVQGNPGGIASGYGEVTFEVVDSSAPALPSTGRPRNC